MAASNGSWRSLSFRFDSPPNAKPRRSLSREKPRRRGDTPPYRGVSGRDPTDAARWGRKCPTNSTPPPVSFCLLFNRRLSQTALRAGPCGCFAVRSSPSPNPTASRLAHLRLRCFHLGRALAMACLRWSAVLSHHHPSFLTTDFRRLRCANACVIWPSVSDGTSALVCGSSSPHSAAANATIMNLLIDMRIHCTAS